MNNFEKLQSMSADDLAAWLDEHLMFDDSPHMQWFVANYCDKCDPIEEQCESYFGTHKCGFAHCELKHKCRYFPNMKDVPDNLETIKLWLESEAE